MKSSLYEYINKNVEGYDILYKTIPPNGRNFFNTKFTKRIKDSNFLDNYDPPLITSKKLEDNKIRSVLCCLEEIKGYPPLSEKDVDRIYYAMKFPSNGENLLPILYSCNLENFQVTTREHPHLFTAIYDILDSKNKNYFLRFFCPYGKFLGIFDKHILKLYFNIFFLENLNAYDFSYYFSSVMSWVFHYHIHYHRFENYTFSFFENTEKIRRFSFNHLKKDVNHFILHITESTSNIRLDKSISSNSSKFIFRKFNINKNDIVEFIKRKYYVEPWRIYPPYIIYEKDTSYYVYEWIKLLKNLGETHLRKNRKKIKIFLQALKELEKSKQFIFRILDHCIRYGIKI